MVCYQRPNTSSLPADDEGTTRCISRRVIRETLDGDSPDPTAVIRLARPKSRRRYGPGDTSIPHLASTVGDFVPEMEKLAALLKEERHSHVRVGNISLADLTSSVLGPGFQGEDLESKLLEKLAATPKTWTMMLQLVASFQSSPTVCPSQVIAFAQPLILPQTR